MVKKKRKKEKEKRQCMGIIEKISWKHRRLGVDSMVEHNQTPRSSEETWSGDL